MILGDSILGESTLGGESYTSLAALAADSLPAVEGVWTLIYIEDGGGQTEKTFAEWGITRPSKMSVNQGLDVFTFEQDGADFTTEDTFKVGSIIITKLGGVRQFYGRVRKPKRRGSADGESMSWRVEGGWYWLMKEIFRQPWRVYSNAADDASELVTKYAGRLFLGQKIVNDTVVYQDSAQQIAEIVNWAISQGAQIAFDPTDVPACQFPVREIVNRSCAECIIMCLQLFPDAVTWFDYSTEPYPTLTIKQRAKLTVKNIDSTGDDYELESGDVSPRDELLNSGVVIEYELVSQVNGKSLRDYVYDLYPDGTEGTTAITGTEPELLLATVSLDGGNFSVASQGVSIGTVNVNSTDFWKAVRPELRDQFDVNTETDIKIKNLTVKPFARLTNLPRYVVDGLFADWMPGRCIEEEFRVLVSYEVVEKFHGQEYTREKYVDKLLSVTLKATDLPQGAKTYQSDQVESPGEPVPIGMAKAIYLATNALAYDGSLTLTEEECSGIVKMGDVVNLMGGLAEYETMNATVQEVTENYETGQTMVRYGTPSHLGPSDIMEFLRALRNRQRFTPFGARANGQGMRGGVLPLQSSAQKQMQAEGSYARTKQTYYDPRETQNQLRVVIDIADLKAIGVNAAQLGDIKMRLYNYCENGTQRRFVALGSLIF